MQLQLQVQDFVFDYNSIHSSATNGFQTIALQSHWWQGYRQGVGEARFAGYQPSDEQIKFVQTVLLTP